MTKSKEFIAIGGKNEQKIQILFLENVTFLFENIDVTFFSSLNPF